MVTDSKDSIIKFVKSFYNENEITPSISLILKEFNLNRTNFYNLFPGGLSELCQSAGVPVPKNRINAVKPALKSKEKSSAKVQQSSLECLTLSRDVTKRVYGVCHLEGGIDPNLAIEKLLCLDTTLRKHKLTLKKVKIVADFLDAAFDRKWKINSLLDYITTLWNLGVHNLDATSLGNLISLIQGIDLRFWGSIQNFISYATMYFVRIGNYRAYLAKKISFQQFRQAEGLA